MNVKLMDHVMAGVEDILGFTGHNNLRDKFEYLDGKYLRPILMREPPLTKHSTIMETFTKLNLKVGYILRGTERCRARDVLQNNYAP